jgi:hypothetical protein
VWRVLLELVDPVREAHRVSAETFGTTTLRMTHVSAETCGAGPAEPNRLSDVNRVNSRRGNSVKSRRSIAAIDQPDRTGDVARSVGCEEGNDLGDLDRLADPS